MHPWHDLNLFTDLELVQAVIEIPKDSKAKYEIDKSSGMIRLDRVLYGSMQYPLAYGILPKTIYDDGDPLDVMVFTQVPVVPLTIIHAHVIGVMRMVDQGIQDDKILAVADKDMHFSHIRQLADIPIHFLDELRNFFENYTKLEGKSVRVPAFLDRQAAMGAIHRAVEMYRAKFG